MHNGGKFPVLGVYIDAVDYAYVTEQVIQAARQRRTLTVTALAVHGVMTGVLDLQQRYRLNHLDLITPDGQPVRMALNWLYKAALTDRVYGPTLMLNICERAAQEKLTIGFYGNQPAVLDDLASQLTARFPDLKIAGKMPSLFRQITPAEKQMVVDKIQAAGVDILFVGLGCPRQETWLYEYRDSLPIPMIAVGAAFNFHSGRLAQAPAWMQKYSLEWFFRLLHDPRRLWQRYLFLNPLYVILLLFQKLRLSTLSPQKAEKPSTELNWG